MSTCEASGANTLVRAQCVDTHALVLANGWSGSTFICVIKASASCVPRRAGTFVATTGQSCAYATIGTGTGETDVFKFTTRSCPSSRTLALELVQRCQDTNSIVGAGVFGVAR